MIPLSKVYCVKDESSHWYVIPYDMREEFFSLSDLIEDSDYDQDLIDKFDEMFSKYRTGGDLNNIQLYAEI